MYAVIKAGGHQYKVSAGDQLEIDLIDGKAGDKVTFPEVLLIGKDGKTTIGAPLIANAKVEATIKEQTFADKITVFKYNPGKEYKVTRGHKQPLTLIEINSITH